MHTTMVLLQTGKSDSTPTPARLRILLAFPHVSFRSHNCGRQDKMLALCASGRQETCAPRPAACRPHRMQWLPSIQCVLHLTAAPCQLSVAEPKRRIHQCHYVLVHSLHEADGCRLPRRAEARLKSSRLTGKKWSQPHTRCRQASNSFSLCGSWTLCPVMVRTPIHRLYGYAP